ncbi:MAG: glycine C-acetyltransferase, partial [Clostridia bacterium]|nr:glycine C-acetyltransferase [Clostridia bacterium]
MNKKEALAFYKQTLGEIEQAGVKKNERIITTPQSAHIFADGKELINMCANNYLGLADNPELIEAAKSAYDK